MTLIKDTPALQDFCQGLVFDAGFPFLAIDTEFIREKTYWPELCLIQVADAEKAVAIDPLAPGIDLSSLWDVLQNPEILKIFHSGRQDIEIFHLLTEKIPRPLFDTQVAAMVCGFGDAISYENLVQRILKKEVDKSSRLTNWSHRPLTPEQLTYALGDVIHLRKLYLWFHKKLEKNKREEWLASEMAVLCDPKTYQTSPENAWLRLKKGGSLQSLKPLSLTVLKELAAYREQVAQQKNRPRRKILCDEALFKIAVSLPKTLEDLKGLRGIPTPLFAEISAEKMMEIIERIRGLPPGQWDKLEEPSLSPPPPCDAAVIALLRLLLKVCSDESGVAQRLIAVSEDLELFARSGEDFLLSSSPLLQGWRFEVFGKEALDLKAGRLALTIQDGKIKRVYGSHLSKDAR